MNAFLDRMEAEVNENLPNADGTNYLRGIADSAVQSGSGIGVDYASPFSLFILGPQVGVGAKLGEGNTTKKLIKGDVKAERIQGAAAQAAIMAGLNLAFLPNLRLGFIDTERLKVFAHFFTYKFDVSEVNIKTTSFGFHGQYNLIRPVKYLFGSVRWGGVDVTTGFRMTNLRANISKRVTETKTETINFAGVGTTTVTGTVEGTASVGANAKVYTIPVEASTNFRLAYILGAFGGLGADFSFGSAKANASVVAPFSLSTNTAIGASGTASLDLGQKKGPHMADFRFFVGPHIELGVLSIYAKYTQAFISDTIGIDVGLKAFW
jgi:hypothetical protein